MTWPEPGSAPVLGGYWRNLTAMQVFSGRVSNPMSCLPRLLFSPFWVSLTCVGSIITQNCVYTVCDPRQNSLARQLARLWGTAIWVFCIFISFSNHVLFSLSPVCFEASICSLFSDCGGRHVWRWTACKLSVFHNTKTIWEVESSCWLWSCSVLLRYTFS